LGTPIPPPRGSIFDAETHPRGAKVISIEATVTLAAQPNPVPLEDRQRLTAAQPFIEVDDPRIRNAADALGGSTPTEIARRAYEWGLPTTSSRPSRRDTFAAR